MRRNQRPDTPLSCPSQEDALAVIATGVHFLEAASAGPDRLLPATHPAPGRPPRSASQLRVSMVMRSTAICRSRCASHAFAGPPYVRLSFGAAGK